MSTSPASVSPDRQGKKTTARARTTIAISWETISAALDKMELTDQLAATLELHRRATRRIETICERLNENAQRHHGAANT